MIEIGAETSEQLDWRSSTLFVAVHVRKKYARRDQLPESGLEPGQQNVVVARKPPEAIPGGLAGPGLLAQVIVSKYTDHLPLYRLEGIFERQGVKLSRRTSDGWVLACADLFAPLHALATRLVLGSRALHADDTPVRVRNAYQKLKYTGRFWTYVGDGRHPLVVFDYTTSRKRDGPAEFLKDYRGYLQADAFGGYDGIYAGSNGHIVEAGCFAHARRKFHESRRLDPPRMETALAWIGKLYAVEKDLRQCCEARWQELTLEERAARIVAQRQERSRPLLDGFHVWLESESHQVLPKSAARAAMDYTLSNWAALCRYTESGWLDIGRVEVWRGGLGFGLLRCQGFPVRDAISDCRAPFPHPAHRTGRADFPHPALLQNFRTSLSARLRGFRAVGTAPASRTSRRRDTVCIPCRDAVLAA